MSVLSMRRRNCLLHLHLYLLYFRLAPKHLSIFVLRKQGGPTLGCEWWGAATHGVQVTAILGSCESDFWRGCSWEKPDRSWRNKKSDSSVTSEKSSLCLSPQGGLQCVPVGGARAAQPDTHSGNALCLRTVRWSHRPRAILCRRAQRRAGSSMRRWAGAWPEGEPGQATNSTCRHRRPQ